MLVAVVGVLLGGLRRLPRGQAAWHASGGRLKVAGASGGWVLRAGWQAVTAASLEVVAQARSKEGSRVDVHARVVFPAGVYRLAPAETAVEGLRGTVTGAAGPAIAPYSLPCLLSLESTGCPEPAQRALATALALAVGAPESAVSVALVVDPQAVAAARLAMLRARMGAPGRRVLVVGWDAADWEILDQLVRQGGMPNLARLLAMGSFGELTSITPLLSPLIWTTMATGVGPETHGILDFMEVDPGSGTRVPITGRQRKVPAVWNLASAAGLQVAVSGWWATWPAETVNGVMLSDRLFYLLSDTVADAPEGTVVFPPEAEPEYRELASRAEAETDERAIRALMPVSAATYAAARAQHKGMADPVDGFRRIMVGTRTYLGGALRAAAARPHLQMVYCIGTDEIGHLLAPYLPPALPGADAAFSVTAQTAVGRYHEVVDRWLGRFIETCPLEECAVLVVSDHGFKWGADRPREFSGTAAATAALWHRPRGVFVLAGHGVSRVGRVAEPASVYDVAPTIAALLGLPAGRDWPGSPLPGCPPGRGEPVSWTTLVPPESYRREGGAVQPSAEAVAQLKSLGYLEGAEGLGQGGGSTEGELNNLGLLHLEAKRYVEAEKAFQGSIARNPAYASPHYNLRRTYFETGRLDAADAALWQAVDRKLRDSEGAVDRAATDYEKAGLEERALALLVEGERRFPTNGRLAVHRLGLLMRSDRCQEAEVAGREAATRLPKDARVHAFWGLAAGCAGDTEAARRALSRSLELDPGQPEVRAALEGLPGS